MAYESCEHFDKLGTIAEPTSHGVCPECVTAGDTWVHLRSCLYCGHVGCCDQSKNQHARRHWKETGHALIQSQERGEFWKFCFVHEAMQ